MMCVMREFFYFIIFVILCNVFCMGFYGESVGMVYLVLDNVWIKFGCCFMYDFLSWLVDEFIE